MKRIVWESPADELDATFAEIAGNVAEGEAPPLAPNDAPVFDGQDRRLYVIGHPGGGTLALSIHDNLQVGWGRPRLHYRTPTLPGSSGSPVFDESWRLMALHHSGSSRMTRLDGKPGTYEANEGLWVHDIVASARQARVQW